MDREAWLAANSLECKALAARITPEACERVRRGHRALNVNARVVPRQCSQCAGLGEDA